MKKIAAILLTCAVALGTAACSSTGTSETATSTKTETTIESKQSEAEEDSKLVYFVGLQSGGPAWVLAQNSFKEACEELGWDGVYVAPTTPNDISQMVTLCETAITEGADVLMTTILSEDSFADVLTRAREQGTIVVSLNTSASEKLIDFWYGTDPITMGTKQADYIIENMNMDEEFTIAFMAAGLGSDIMNEKYKYLAERFAEYPNVTLMEPQIPGNDAIKTADMLSALLKTNPEIKVVIADSGQIALGIGNYVQENGLESELLTIGIDQSPDTLNYVKQGALDCTMTQGWYIMGHDTVLAANDLMNGKEVAFDNDAGVVCVEADGVEAFAEEAGVTLE